MRREFVEKTKAYWGGYFWLPCPMCGKMFGGHEKGLDMLDPNDNFRGKMTCADPVCKRRVEEYNHPIREKRENDWLEAMRKHKGEEKQ